MLLLNSSKTIIVDGVTVFPDHADPNQFWYLPAPVHLGRRQQDDRAQFTFIKYKPAAVNAGKGGGFLMFEVNLRLDPSTENKIRSRVSSLAKGRPLLSPVPFDEGTVQCIALNVQGSGGTIADAALPGTFNAVEKILGASVPSLQGDNTAAFSLSLNQEGAIILEQAFKQGTTPVGVLYNLKFTGIRPALHVKITADYKRIYNSFSASLSGQYYFFQLGIEAGLEKLVQDGAIQVEVINFSTEGDKKEKEKWALEFFMDKLLGDWFDNTLSPGQIAGSSGTGGGTTPTPGGGGSGGGVTPPTPGGGVTPPVPGGVTPPVPGGSGGGGGGEVTPPAPGGSSGGVTPPPGPGMRGPASPSIGLGADTPGGLPPAQLLVESRDPDPLPSGYEVVLGPASGGTSEVITVRSGTQTPIVRVDGQPRVPNISRQITVDVQPGATALIEVEYPAVTAVSETFRLLFDKAEPAEQGWTVTTPPSGLYARYVNSNPSPPNDDQFNATLAPNSNSPRGAAALRRWVQDRLVDPKQVSLDAHASFEGDGGQNKRDYNARLSQRRLDVATGIIQSTTAQIIHAQPHGQDEAEASHRRDQASDRVVRITGITTPASSPMRLRARLTRASTPGGGGTTPTPTPTPGGGGGTTPMPTPAPGGGGTTPTPTPTPGGGGGTTPTPTPTPGGGGTTPTPGGTAGNPAIALKLKFIHQEELKTIKIEYNSQEAVQRTYAPQGFFGLMLDDLEDKNKYFVEVDLDAPFFRVFTVTVDAPIDFRAIGLNAAHVALDYGSPADAANHRHSDFIFDAQNTGEKKFEVFMNAQHDTRYTYRTQYHFDPTAGWDGEHFSYELPARPTEDRTLYLNPFEDLGFLEVRIVPGRIDWEVITSIDVFLRYSDPSGWVKEQFFALTPSSTEQRWKLRLSNPAIRSYAYHFIHHLKDGTTRSTQPVVSQVAAVTVDDPFDDALEIFFFPAFDISRTKIVFIDVTYDDDDNNYHRDEHVRVEAGTTDEVSLRISLLDPSKRQFKYRFVLVGPDGQVRRGRFIAADVTELSIQED